MTKEDYNIISKDVKTVNEAVGETFKLNTVIPKNFNGEIFYGKKKLEPYIINKCVNIPNFIEPISLYFVFFIKNLICKIVGHKKKIKYNLCRTVKAIICEKCNLVEVIDLNNIGYFEKEE